MKYQLLSVFFAIFFVVFLITIVDVKAWADYDIEKLQPLNSTVDPVDFRVKTKRYNRTTFAINGKVEFKDLTGYDAELQIWYSPTGNSQWVLSPYKLPRAAICETLNKDYRQFLMNDLKDVSDFPYSDDTMEDLCPKFKGTFTVTNFYMYNTTIPADLDDGMYKVLGYIYRGQEIVCGIYMLIRLY